MRPALKWTASILVGICAVVLLVGPGLLHLVRKRVDSHAPALTADNVPETDLVFHTLDGKPARLSEYKGKAVFLNLWGTWCIQCIAEMPTVQRLYNHYRNDPNVAFLIVSRMDSPEAVERYARRSHYSLPFYVMNDDDIPHSMYLHQYPATFLYSPQGLLVAHHAGGANWDDPAIIHFIDKLKHQ